MGWSLPSEMTGSAEWLIIPYSEAALESDHVYDVGGTLRYSSDGSNITVPLLPTVITVRPDPSLLVHYFWERYVIGDDPFTDEVEPSVPFTLGVAVKNAGHGTAYSLRITSGQPEIIENERGLLISFMIIGANIGNEAISPSLTVAFGDLTPNTTKVARWLMLSSLQGEFMNYSATFENINPLGDPRLSLLDELDIHELIRNVMIYSDPDENDGILDFLVNERDDFLAYPDTLYSSKTLQSYNVSAGIILSVRSIASSIPALLEVRTFSNSTGWVYYRYEDTQGLLSETASAVNVTKYESGVATSLPPENSWITRQNYRGARRTTENLYLHIVDSVETAGEVVFIVDLCRVNCNRATTDMTTPATSTQATTTITSTTDSTTPATPTQTATTTSTTDTTTPATPTLAATTTTLSTTEMASTGILDIQTSSDATTVITGQPTTATSTLSTDEVTPTADMATTAVSTQDTTSTSAETTSTGIQTPSATDITTSTLTTTMTADINDTTDTTPPSTDDLATTTTASPLSTLDTTMTDTTDVPTTSGMPNHDTYEQYVS